MRTNKSALLVVGAVFSGVVLSGAIAQVGLPDPVETTTLSRDAFSTGTLARGEGALPPTLWDGSDPQTLEYLLDLLPQRPSAPSYGDAIRRVLLSPGTAPRLAAPSLGGKKLLALSRAGFVAEAQNIASLSTVGGGDPWTGQALAIADLLSGDVQRACQRNANLRTGRDNPFWVKLRVLCYAQAGEPDAADLTFNLLRDQGSLNETDIAFLSAAVTGIAPKSGAAPVTALHLAIARSLKIELAPGDLANANGAVLTTLARDVSLDHALRIKAAQGAVSIGVMAPDLLAAILGDVDFDVSEVANATTAMRDQAASPLTDALAFQAIADMSAPEFIRDKAQRIAQALSIADSFERAYALSLVYASDIKALEGVLVTPDEALIFSNVAMATGDSVGAGAWLRSALGSNDSVAALPEPIGLRLIDGVNRLAILDPQTAAQIARAAGISLLSTSTPALTTGISGHEDPAVMARIVEAAFDAAMDGKTGQAALAALAAANGDDVGGSHGGQVEAVIIEQALRAAGLGDLSRRNAFDRAWAATFQGQAALTQNSDNGLLPRVKPQ